VVVTNVDADSTAADVGGIGRGTVILAVDRHPVTNVADFKRLMAQAQGKPVLLTTNNGGATGFVVVQPK
jgi:S1-C subfamily serine protease